MLWLLVANNLRGKNSRVYKFVRYRAYVSLPTTSLVNNWCFLSTYEIILSGMGQRVVCGPDRRHLGYKNNYCKEKI